MDPSTMPEPDGDQSPHHAAFLDLDSDIYLADPYPTLARLRTRGAAVRDSRGLWEFLRYDDVETLLRDPRMAAGGPALLTAQGVVTGPFFDWWGLLMFQTEGAMHHRLRRLGAKLISEETEAWTRRRAIEIANELLDRVTTGRMDVLADFAHRLPVVIVCELMGIPAEYHEQVGAWSDDVALGLSIAISPSSVARIDTAVRGLCDAARTVRHARHPLTAGAGPILRAAADGFPVTEAELVALLSNLLYAGHLTTKNLIGNGVLALLQNPDQLNRLRREPHLIDTAVEEFLRYDAPISGVVRRVVADFAQGGVELRANEFIVLSLLSANHDPARFDSPDRLDIARAHNRHLSFGWGTHYCLGAALARIEATVAISTLLDRFTDIRLATPYLSWRRSTRVRGLEELLVQVEAV